MNNNPLAKATEQLKVLFKNGVTWDGDLINKAARDELYKLELVDKCEGWNFITKLGVRYLVSIGFAKP